MAYSELLADIEKYVTGLFENNSKKLPFHNLAHTRQVVQQAKQIAAHYALSEVDFFIVISAAWFHDTGYINGELLAHEQRGADLLANFLKKNLVPDDIITKITECILSTILPQKPESLLQKIICDSDLYHFGTPDLFSHDALMLTEIELRMGKKIEENKWLKATIQLLESHEFHTTYCQDLLNEGKRMNLQKLYNVLEQV